MRRFHPFLIAALAFAVALSGSAAFGAPKQSPKAPHESAAKEHSKPKEDVEKDHNKLKEDVKDHKKDHVKPKEVVKDLKKDVKKDHVKPKEVVKDLKKDVKDVKKDHIKLKEDIKDVRHESVKHKNHETIAKIIRERDANVRRFANFNQRTGEYSFDSRSWYSLVEYPTTVARSVSFQADYANVVPPANITVTPPVIKRGNALPISREGLALAALLDGLDVEHHWLPGKKTDWKTGNIVNGELEGPASNGGAFVAAVCFRNKVPMPAPTAENFWPGNQHDWLAQNGKAKGWVVVADVEAQLLANQGWVVVAAWRNLAAPGERALSGQTAIVRPSQKPATEIAERGPRIIDAGPRNHNDVALKDSFPARARNNHEVVYFAHRPR